MDGKRGLNRRGQEGVSLTTLLLIILGLVVVVVLIIGFTKGFDFIFGKFDILPLQDLEAVSQSCGLAVSAGLGDGLKADYCVDLKKVEINGKEQYVTCDHLEKDGYWEGTLDCGALKPNLEEVCTNLDLKTTDLVNGENCPAEVEANVETGGEAGSADEDSGTVDSNGNLA